MSFRLRVTLLVAAAIALTVTAASTAVWATAKHELVSQVDASLYRQASDEHSPFTVLFDASGATNRPTSLAIPARAKRVAAGEEGAYYATVELHGVRVREFVAPLRDGAGAVLTVQSMEATDRALDRIKFWAFLVGGIGIAAAAALAALVAGAALRPVRRLTAAAETVAQTGNLGERVDVTGSDELGRLAARFNAMLASLEESVGRQRRLVADASHELRTPLTAVRTNVELLREGRLAADDAKHALAEASTELDALTTLLSDLVELARGEERKLRLEQVQLDDLVAASVERARARAPHATFVTALSPTQVHADPVLLERAIANLLDNAVKYSPAGAPIEVSVRAGEVVVADQGPGIAETDLPRIFDRFYRAAAARAKPGAGLGLAIVKEAAEAHGGTATAESSARGARFRLTLPAAT